MGSLNFTSNVIATNGSGGEVTTDISDFVIKESKQFVVYTVVAYIFGAIIFLSNVTVVISSGLILKKGAFFSLYLSRCPELSFSEGKIYFRRKCGVYESESRTPARVYVEEETFFCKYIVQAIPITMYLPYTYSALLRWTFSYI